MKNKPSQPWYCFHKKGSCYCGLLKERRTHSLMVKQSLDKR